jgi:hypothetical protein
MIVEPSIETENIASRINNRLRFEIRPLMRVAGLKAHSDPTFSDNPHAISSVPFSRCCEAKKFLPDHDVAGRFANPKNYAHGEVSSLATFENPVNVEHVRLVVNDGAVNFYPGMRLEG